jgi:catechol 2,3-dioxygenase
MRIFGNFCYFAFSGCVQGAAPPGLAYRSYESYPPYLTYTTILVYVVAFLARAISPRKSTPIAFGISMATISNPAIDPAVRIGHVHLKVSNLQRAIDFYHGILGFEVMVREGDKAAFLSAGGYHHHFGLNTWESAGGSPPPPGTTGLYHVAILYPTRELLAAALQRLIRAGIHLEGASDHGVSEALYLRDPDDNGVELCWDRPKEQWPRTAEGKVTIYTKRLDVQSLLAIAPQASASRS